MKPLVVEGIYIYIPVISGILINHELRIPMKQPKYSWKVGPGFLLWLTFCWSCFFPAIKSGSLECLVNNAGIFYTNADPTPLNEVAGPGSFDV